MSTWTFLHAERVHLVWAALLLVGLLAWLDRRGRASLDRFVSAIMQARLATSPGSGRRFARHLLVLASLVLGVGALMRPQSRSALETLRTRRAMADLLFVLDVSRSMLAEDAAPSRLLRAKAEIDELVDKLTGERVGLVAFAGRPAVLSPLTPDYSFFRVALRNADPRAAGRGGTRIGDAIRKGIEVLGPGSGARLMLLVTDGEDHESFPRDAASKAAEAGIRIVTIGFGKEGGSEIRITDPETGAKSVLRDAEGAPVLSRLDGELLREIALTTEGVYVPAGTATLDLESIVEAHLRPLVRETQEVARTVTLEYYRWLVLGSLLCLVAAVWVGSTAGRPAPAGS